MQGNGAGIVFYFANPTPFGGSDQAAGGMTVSCMAPWDKRYACSMTSDNNISAKGNRAAPKTNALRAWSQLQGPVLHATSFKSACCRLQSSISREV